MTNEIQFRLYNSQNNEGRVQGVAKAMTIWLTQKALTQLFGVNVQTISKHPQNIYGKEELKKSTTISKIGTVVNCSYIGEGNGNIDFHNLDIIISVSNHINSTKTSLFHQQTTNKSTKSLASRIIITQ